MFVYLRGFAAAMEPAPTECKKNISGLAVVGEQSKPTAA